MSDRLQQLRRQRAVVAEHLAWLDGEIAQAQQTPALNPAEAPAPDDLTTVPFSMRAVLPPPAKASGPAAASAPTSIKDSASAAAADEILRDYQVEPEAMKSDVKKGCLLYFFGALGLVALGVTVLYFVFQRGR